MGEGTAYAQDYYYPSFPPPSIFLHRGGVGLGSLAGRVLANAGGAWDMGQPSQMTKLTLIFMSQARYAQDIAFLTCSVLISLAYPTLLSLILKPSSINNSAVLHKSFPHLQYILRTCPPLRIKVLYKTKTYLSTSPLVTWSYQQFTLLIFLLYHCMGIPL